jgi:hypothetical protein
MRTPRPSKRSTSRPRPGRGRTVAIAAITSLGVGVAGCGGSGTSPKTTTTTTTAAISKAEFVAKANAICASADPNLAVENAKLAATHPTPATVVAAVKGVYLPSVEAQLASIRALGTPAGDSATIARMLTLVQGDLARVRANPALITTDVFGDFAKVAHGYGLTACAPLS